MRQSELEPYREDRVRQFKAEGWWNDDVIGDLLAGQATDRPDRPAVVAAGATITWGELRDRADRLAGGLRAIGLGPGDVVAVQLPNIPEFLIAFLAINRIGGVLQTVHMAYRAAELKGLVGHSGARAMICLDRFRDYPSAEVMVGLKGELAALETVIVLGPPVAGGRPFAELAAAAPFDEDYRPGPEAPFLLLYTSGTTSGPKGVALRYQAFLSNARLAVDDLAIGEDDRFLSLAPYSHLYGLFTLLVSLYSGATNLMLAAFSPPDFAELVASGRPTGVFAAPAHCAAALAAGLFDTHDFGSVRFLKFAGSICPSELAIAVEDKLPNGMVTHLWGMTELQAGSYTRPDDPPAVRYHTIGRASPGNELRVVDEAGRPLPAGTEGELQARGISVFTGYYKNDAANRAAFTADGWFRTGDLARFDGTGNLVVTGRIKDVINRGGVKFNPADVEALINAMAEVQISAMVPVADPILGERACCFVQPTPGARPTLAAICAHLEAHQVAKNTWPEQLELVDAMPLTPTNKVIKGALTAKPHA